MKENEKENIADSILQLRANKEILSKLYFLKETETQNDLKIKYQLIGNYVFVSSSRSSIQKIIKDYAFYVIKQNSNTYYAMRFPDGRETREELRTLLRSFDIKIFTRFIVDSTPFEKNYHLPKKEKLPRFWTKKIKLLKQQLSKVADFEIYMPPQTPCFPIYFFGENLMEFIAALFGNGSKPVYEFYCLCLIHHLMRSTGILKQQRINTVKANTADIRRLLPASLTFKEVSKNIRMKKTGKTLTFTFNSNAFENFIKKIVETTTYDEETDEEITTTSIKRRQFVLVPFSLFRYILTKVFFRKNLRFFFLLLYGYKQFKNPKCFYKPSTIANAAELNTTRGKEYLYTLINNALTELKNIGVVRAFGCHALQDNKKTLRAFTLDDVKQDNGIIIYLNSLEFWQPPAT